MDNNDFMNLLNSQENPNSSQHFSTYQNNSYYPNNLNSQINSQYEYTPNYVEQPQLSQSPSKNKNKKTTKRGESRPWQEKEDEALMSAWGIISGDPVQGNNQKDQIRWGKVWELYELSRVENPNEIGSRNPEALRCRFRKLSENASKWHGSIKKVLNRGYKSGTNDAYIESEAQKIYREESKNNASYGELNVYKNVMSKYRRWNLQRTDVNWNEEPISHSDGSSKRSRADESDEPNQGTCETIPETPHSVYVGETIPRPEGREAAKKKRKGKSVCSETSNNPQLSIDFNALQIVRQEGNQIMKDRLNFEREKLQAESERELRTSEMMIYSTLLVKPNLTQEEESLKNYIKNKYWPTYN